MLQVLAYDGADQLEACLKGTELVLIPAGVPRKPGLWFFTLLEVQIAPLLQLVGEQSTRQMNGLLSLLPLIALQLWSSYFHFQQGVPILKFFYI